jgi:putative CocE/NonD family hydrolase
LPFARGDGDESLRARYTKYEHRIPMRDGKRLFTAVYVPKDASRPRPILLNRTPYSVAPYGVDRFREHLGPSDHFVKENYILVYQDVRGRYMSEGDWVEMTPHKAKKASAQDVDESTDAWDTIDWLVRNVPGNNGRVGLWGISYPGFYVSASMIDAHPALKAASPQAPVTDLFMGDDSYHNGAFMLAANFGFFVNFSLRGGEPKPPPTGGVRFDYGTPDGYDFHRRLGPLSGTLRYLGGHRSWMEALEHPTYDEYWKSRNIAAHLKNIKHAVLTVGGWFDAEDLAGPLLTYRTIEQSSPATFNAIVMGPWSHGGWAREDGDRLGNLSFGSKTSAYYREAIEYAFFARHLAGAPTEAVAEATMFQTGTNEWRRYDAWPPKTAVRKAFYFGPGRRLVAEAPTQPEAYDEYPSDPQNPVPYLGYTAQGMRSDYMTEDQRFAATRPDVVFYETEPLEEDLAVAGPIEVDLHVSTTGTDSDFVVKLVDVYPSHYPSYVPKDEDEDPPARKIMMGGYQQLVRGEPFRGRFRNGFEKPEAFVPGQPARIHFSLPDVCHVFRRGHRVMVQVQSSWFPLVDLNPQTFVEIPKATASDFRRATQRVYRGREQASSVTLRVDPPRRPEAPR